MIAVILGVEAITVYGIISGALVSAGTLAVAVRSSRGDAMTKTMQGALELGDRYKDEWDEMRKELDSLRTELTKCTEMHSAAAADLEEVRHLAEMALSADTIGPLLADASDGWFTLGSMGELQDFNRGFLSVFSLSESEALAPGSWRDRVLPEDLTALDAVATHVFNTQSHLHTSFRVRIGDQLVPVLARAHPKTSAGSGEFMGWRGILIPQWSQSEDAPAPWPSAPPTPWGTYPE